MKKRTISLLLICEITSIFCNAQLLTEAKKIKVKGDYSHNETETVFPTEIDDYKRISIYAFDSKNTNLGVTYQNTLDQKKTTLSIYIYPAGFGSVDRLIKEYQTSLQVSNMLSIHLAHARQSPVSYSRYNYRVIGLKAEILDLPVKSSLILYECGRWFFKVRITSDYLDSLGVTNLENRVLDFFIPTNLVQKAPLNHKADILFTKAAFVDSLMLGSVMGSALEKIQWALFNVDSLHRASGFPGLYFDMHLASYYAFVQFEKSHINMARTKPTTDILDELNSLINSGFLDEFIMEQYDKLLIAPEGKKFDFAEFTEWKKSHPIHISPFWKYYDVGYE